MKNQYHKKIEALESELTGLEKEKHDSLKKVDSAKEKSKLDDQYKKKMKEMNEKLNEFKMKDREQKQMT